MEDGVEEIQNTILFADKSRAGAADKGAEQRVEQMRDEDEKERPTNGLISNLISTLVSGSGEGNEEVHGEKMRPAGGLTGEERNKEEEKESGGLINHLFSNLVSPIMSTAEVDNKRKADEFEIEAKAEDNRGDRSLRSEEEFGGGGGGGGGGIINNLISNIFHQDHGDQGGEEGKVKHVNKGAEQVKSEGDGGGGLVESLVSSLPTPLALAEDAAPATDEASILIHSIVHD